MVKRKTRRKASPKQDHLPHKLGKYGELSKPIMIAIVAVVGLAILALLLVFTDQFAGKAIADSYTIRRNALMNKITYYTTLSGAKAACVGMSYVDELEVNSIQSLHK